MLRLTKHFIANWEKRVGGTPTVDEVQQLLRESVIVQSCATYQTVKGRPYVVLAIYWHTEKDLILKVDMFTGNVVTVLSKSTDGNPVNGGL